MLVVNDNREAKVGSLGKSQVRTATSVVSSSNLKYVRLGQELVGSSERDHNRVVRPVVVTVRLGQLELSHTPACLL